MNKNVNKLDKKVEAKLDRQHKRFLAKMKKAKAKANTYDYKNAGYMNGNDDPAWDMHG